MKSSEGRQRAIEYAPRLADLTLQYKRLNSREARVAFIDTWLKTWAYDFEKTWPVIYQVLQWVEQDELYRDPRAMSPNEIYPDFRSFFEARIKRPFTLWMELEQTHHYMTKFAPELIEKTFAEAHSEAAAKMQEMDKRDRASERPVGTNQFTEDVYDKEGDVHTRPTGNRTDAALRRLRHAAESGDERVSAIYQRVLDGEITANAGMVEAGFRKKRPSEKKSRTDKVIATLEQMTRTEQRVVWQFLSKRFG